MAAIQATVQMPLGSTFDVGSGSAEPAGRVLGDGLLEGLGDGPAGRRDRRRPGSAPDAAQMPRAGSAIGSAMGSAKGLATGSAKGLATGSATGSAKGSATGSAKGSATGSPRDPRYPACMIDAWQFVGK
jgi:hypothetical protein